MALNLSWIGIVAGRRLWLAVCLLAAGLLIALALSIPVLATSGGSNSNVEEPVHSKVDSALQAKVAEEGPGAIVDFIVYLDGQADLSAGSLPQEKLARRYAVVERLKRIADASQASLLPELERMIGSGNVIDFQQLWIINAILVGGDAEAIRVIASHPEVLRIMPNTQIKLVDQDTPAMGPSPDGLTWGLKTIRAGHAWEALGFDGAGVTVAIMDSGVDWLHPALHENYRGNRGGGGSNHVLNWFDAVDGSPVPIDPFGHGTHVAGTAVGQLGIGVAPGAKWIAVRIIDQFGFATIGDIHAGFQYILAPSGNPNHSPDVVNASWGGPSDSLDLIPDITALKAAGIIPVFAAGNSGPNPGTILAPANYTHTLAIGASDDTDSVTWFSSRGPSDLTDEVKPSIVAPGARVLSSLPGNAYGYSNGTSMATPHAAGTIALLFSMNPTLAESEITRIITRTALPIESDVPNFNIGWGRLDAYAAMSTLAGEPDLTVFVYSDGNFSQPLPGIVVTLTTPSGVPLPFVTGASGEFEAWLLPGDYELSISEFGFAPYPAESILITQGQSSQQIISLTPLPRVVIRGVLRDAQSLQPLTGTVRVENTAIEVQTNHTGNFPGRYELLLPVGDYDLTASVRGHYLARARVTISPRLIFVQDFLLEPSFDTLLVDSGQYYYSNQIDYFRHALEDNDLGYDTWTIANPNSDVPSAELLSGYDVVVWSSPNDSPGSLGASDVISTYLGLEGNLLISGQNVGSLDENLIGQGHWWRTLLGGHHIGKAEPPFQLEGDEHTVFDGLDLALNGPDSADNQDAIDKVEPGAESLAQPAFHHQDGEAAGLLAGLCESFRIVYLGFGLEGVSGGSSRADIVAGAYNYFAEPEMEVGALFTPAEISDLAPPGGRLTYTISLRNLSQLYTDTFEISYTDGPWPTSIMTPTLTLGPCQVGYSEFSITVPDDLPVNTVHELNIKATSQNFPAYEALLPVYMKTADHILVVDDHLWYDQGPVFRASMDENNFSYDYWIIGPPGLGRGSPSRDLLNAYDIVIWYTGYDWFEPITDEEREALEEYLIQGGRLFLTSQDYLSYHQNDRLTREFFGVRHFQETVTPTQVYGGNDPSLMSNLGGPLTLDYGQYQNHSDGLIPIPDSQASLWHDQGMAAGLANTPPAGDGTWRTVFWALPFEKLPDDSRALAMNQIVGWLSDLGDSSFEVDRRTTPLDSSPPAVRTYTITLRNMDVDYANHLAITNTLPSELQLDPATIVGGASFDPQTNRLIWRGDLGPAEQHIIRYQATPVPGLSAGTRIDNRVIVSYEEHDLRFERLIPLWLGTPDLIESSLDSQPARAYAGEPITYRLLFQNEGHAAGFITATLRLPDELRPVTDTLATSSGLALLLDRTVTWHGFVDVGQAITVSLVMTPPLATKPSWLMATAILEDGVTNPVIRDTIVYVTPHLAYLPAISRN